MNLSSDDYQNILEDLRRKLHDPRGSKAAVMVGAGFSRNAKPRFGGGRQFPIWSDLTRRFVEHLYTEESDRSRVLEAAGATSSALRLAEEYEAAFGRSALIELVRQETSDEDFLPSKLHEKLVDLPWVDIFTTNYDRLIERAAMNSPGRSLRRYSYELVTQTTDIPLARRPRIVKLHGTLPDLTNLVLTEEDFRCYETRNSGFVNAVRSSMSENAFCLLGFSGDDPNFLAWSGWIRDTLRDATPTIYLFCTTPPAPFKRRLLESRNIRPIPLNSIFKTNHVSESLGKLLDFLGRDSSCSTANWNRPPNSVQLDSEDSENEPWNVSEVGWVKTAIRWRKSRLEYRGWEVLHRRALGSLWGRTQFPLRDFKPSQISQLSILEKLFVARELLWRLTVCMVPVDDQIAFEILDPLIEEVSVRFKEPCSDIVPIEMIGGVKISTEDSLEAYRFVLCQLIRHAREIRDECRFNRFHGLLQICCKLSPDEVAFIEHQRILFELGALSYDSARKRLKRWNVDGLPAIWTVRKCGLLLEVGEAGKARTQLLELIDSLVTTRVEQTIDYRRHSVEALALYQMELVNCWDENINPERKQEFGNDEVSDDSQDDEVPETTLNESASYKDFRSIPKSTERPQDRKFEPEIIGNKLTNRLRELNRLGCDPEDLLHHFCDLFRHQENESFEFKSPEPDNFDIDRKTTTHRSADDTQLGNAYRVIRFTEESGIPIFIHGVFQLNTAIHKTYLASACMVAKKSYRETGALLRSRDDKILKTWLNRWALSSIDDPTVDSLLRQTLSCFHLAYSRTMEFGRPRSHDSQWWAGQLGFSTILLSRLIPRLNDDQMFSIAKDILLLSGDPKAWNRLGISGELRTLIRRLTKCIRSKDLLSLVPNLVELPVSGDTLAGFAECGTQDWYDPLSQLESIESGEVSSDLLAHASRLIEKIPKSSGDHRRRLVLRSVSLLQHGLLDEVNQANLRDAIFLKLDEDGFPDETGCFDSLILGLPKQKDVDETELYRRAYLKGSRQVDLNFWANLARSTDQDQDRRERRRSVAWTSDDLRELVSRTSQWASSLQTNKAANEKLPQLARAFLGGDENYQRAIREWLQFISEVVLMAPDFSDELRQTTSTAIQQVSGLGICTIRLLPFMLSRGMVGVEETRNQLREALLDDDEFVSWQACSAIVQWGRLVTSSKVEWYPRLELMLSSAILHCRNVRLVLYLTAARELLEVYPVLKSTDFFFEIILALTDLFDKTSYKSSSKLRVEERIRVRIACIKLASQMQRMGLQDTILNEWLLSARSDCFAEVRRAEVPE
jgi:hypothetical protein